MAHFPYVRAPGTWLTGTAIDPAELEAINLYIFKAANFDDGGTWAPSTVVTIGGSGLTVTGQSRLDDVRNILVNAAGSFASNADAEFNALLDITSTGSFHVAVGASYSVEADGAFLGEIDFSDKLRMNAGAFMTIQSGASLTVDVGATLNIRTDITLIGALIRDNAAGRFRVTNRSLKTTNTSQTVGVEYDYIEMNVAGAGAITLTLKIATAPTPTENETIRIRKIGAGAGGLTIQNEGSAASLATVTGANTANFVVMFEATSNKWRVFSAIGTYSLGADAV